MKTELTASTVASADKPATATAILDAAERLCGSHGIEAVSIRDIAAEVGVSISVIYHHYKSKANLLQAIVRTRFEEIREEHERLLNELEAQNTPAVGDIVRAVLQPINQWRRPEREAALQFYSLALVSPLPALKEAIDAGVGGLRRVVVLLERALPQLSHEDICWRLHFTMKISHLSRLDAARLNILSKGACRGDHPNESLARGIAFAEAAFMAPPIRYPNSSATRSKTTGGRSARGARSMSHNRASSK